MSIRLCFEESIVHRVDMIVDCDEATANEIADKIEEDNAQADEVVGYFEEKGIHIIENDLSDMMTVYNECTDLSVM